MADAVQPVPVPVAPPAPDVDPNARLTLVLLVLVTALTGVGLSIMSVAFPAIVEDFDDWSPGNLSWITNVFTIIGAGVMIPAGVIADQTSRKRLVLLGVAVFTIGSVLGGIAPNPGTLIAARSFQAVGASMFTPAATALLIAAYPPERLSFAVGIWAAAGGVSSALGPSLGGFLIEVGGWQWAFWVNVPAGVIVLALGPRVFLDPPARERRPLPDLLGAVMLMAGISLVVLGVVQGDRWGWGSRPTLGAIVAGVVVLAVLLRRTMNHPSPLMDITLFRIPSLRAANLGILFFAPGWFAMFFGLITFMTEVWDYSLLDAGATTAPLALISGTMGIALGHVAGRTGHRVFLVPGTLGYMASTVFLWVRLGPEPGLWSTMIPGMVALGVSSGMVFPSFMAAGVIDAPPDRHAVASSIGFTTQRIATTLGVAAAATILSAGDASTVDAYDRLFAIMLASGLAGLVAGSFVDTRPQTLTDHRDAVGSRS